MRPVPEAPHTDSHTDTGHLVPARRAGGQLQDEAEPASTQSTSNRTNRPSKGIPE